MHCRRVESAHPAAAAGRGPPAPQVYHYESVDVGFGWTDSGYFQRFNDTDLGVITAQLGALQQNRWIDAGTRFIRVDFVVYNPNVGLFVLVMFELDLLNSGQFVATYDSEASPPLFPRAPPSQSRTARPP